MKPETAPTEPNIWYGLMQAGPITVRLLDMKGTELAFKGYRRLKPYRKPRFIDRKNGATLRYACDSCGSWIDAAIAHLARSLRESGLAA